MPPAWTENEGWFDTWGQVPLLRTSASVAYSVAIFVAYGGAYHNYCINLNSKCDSLVYLSNICGMAETITARPVPHLLLRGMDILCKSSCYLSLYCRYANDVLMDSMALPHEPKFTFLGNLHFLLRKYAKILQLLDNNI